jgi:hypothetical protein
LESEVYTAALSNCAQEHTLIAAACEDGKVYLCDIRTGKSIWKLEGKVILLVAVVFVLSFFFSSWYYFCFNP